MSITTPDNVWMTAYLTMMFLLALNAVVLMANPSLRKFLGWKMLAYGLIANALFWMLIYNAVFFMSVVKDLISGTITMEYEGIYLLLSLTLVAALITGLMYHAVKMMLLQPRLHERVTMDIVDKSTVANSGEPLKYISTEKGPSAPRS